MRTCPATFLVADVDGDLVGRVSIRHVLNARLAAVGGHVGYGVRPGFRRLGHATRMLQLALERLGDLGVERALVTCDVDNTGSAATILSCGGTPAAPTPATADHQPDRNGTHGLCVRDTGGHSLVADVVGAGPVGAEVHAFHHRVGGDRQVTGESQHGAVVSDAQHNRSGRAEPRGDPPDQGELAELADVLA